MQHTRWAIFALSLGTIGIVAPLSALSKRVSDSSTFQKAFMEPLLFYVAALLILMHELDQEYLIYMVWAYVICEGGASKR